MNMISFLNTSDRTAWTQTGPEKPFGFSGPVPCLCNTSIPAIDYFLISPPQMVRGSCFLRLFEAQNVFVFDEVFRAGIERRHGDEDPDDRVQPLDVLRDAERHHQDDADHGDGGLDLARPRGGDDAAVVHRDEAQPRNGKLAHQHEDQHPRRHGVPLDEHRHRREHQYLVRQRVHELAEVGDLMVVPGDVAVQRVRQARDDEHR